jgi:predicted ArsR family transcriptional regulator
VPELQKKIFGLLEVHGVVSTPDIARQLQVPERTVRYHLRQMTEAGLVEQEGTARKTRRYRLPFRQFGERQKDSDAGVTTAKQVRRHQQDD